MLQHCCDARSYYHRIWVFVLNINGESSAWRNLWMTGDQGYYEQLCEIISSHGDLNDQTEALEDWIRFEYDGGYSSLWADLINNSLAEVD